MLNMMPMLLTGGVSSMESVMNNDMSMAERLIYSLRMTAIGLLMVFAVLGIICFVMYLFRLFFYTLPNRRSKKADEVRQSDVSVIPSADPNEVDPALIAVLSAAVAAVLADEAEAAGTPAPSFRVVSFRRTSRGRGWNEKV